MWSKQSTALFVSVSTCVSVYVGIVLCMQSVGYYHCPLNSWTISAVYKAHTFASGRQCSTLLRKLARELNSGPSVQCTKHTHLPVEGNAVHYSGS